MTQQFGVERVDARNAVQSLVQSSARIISATDTTVLGAYDISATKNHDVYDAFLLALACSYEADYLQMEQTECLRIVRKSKISVMNVGQRPTNLRAGDAREQLTRDSVSRTT